MATRNKGPRAAAPAAPAAKGKAPAAPKRKPEAPIKKDEKKKQVAPVEEAAEESFDDEDFFPTDLPASDEEGEDAAETGSEGEAEGDLEDFVNGSGEEGEEEEEEGEEEEEEESEESIFSGLEEEEDTSEEEEEEEEEKAKPLPKTAGKVLSRKQRPAADEEEAEPKASKKAQLIPSKKADKQAKKAEAVEGKGKSKGKGKSTGRSKGRGSGEDGEDLDTLIGVSASSKDGESEESEEEEEDEKEDEKMPMEVRSSSSDTSDDEHARNTVGKIPMEWYKDYEHIGYDLDGKRIAKGKQKDQLDKFLDKMENPDYGRTITDPVTGEEILLSNEDIALIKQIQGGEFPTAGSLDPENDPYAPYVDFFTHEKMIHPLSSAPEPKRRFVPSKHEHKKIMKIVRAIRKGLIKPKEKRGEVRVFDLWGESSGDALARLAYHIPAPKVELPHHAESYNPPPEYLPTDKERKDWEDMDPEDRPRNFLPQKYKSLRLVPAYSQFTQERFSRCLDLYLCPRQRKMRLNIDPDSLIPQLPSPRDLKPFPHRLALTYVGHTSRVTAVAVDPTGQWLATGSDDKTVRVWEVSTARCVKLIHVEEEVNSLSWCPNTAFFVLAIAARTKLYLISPGFGSRSVVEATDKALQPQPPSAKPVTNPAKGVSWRTCKGSEHEKGHRFVLDHVRDIVQVTWHVKGNYFATVMPGGGSDTVAVHSLLKQSSQNPMKKNRDVQRVLFHPRQPLFFVASKTHVWVYNLQTQQLVKKLLTGVKWLSSLDIHPGGDNLIIGSFDCRLCWFDLDLSVKPYKTLRYHKFAIRAVKYHNGYPLFASCSDDGSVHVFHGMVYNDLLQNPLIVPVKILRAHKKMSDGLGVLDMVFHPRQPWLFTAGADGAVKLFT